MGSLFGTDGLRGEANKDVTAEQAYYIGNFLGSYFTAERGERAKILIGKDTRRSSYFLEAALSCGVTSSGADACLMHVTTTPSVAHVVRSEGFDCGIMVSASHNPFYDNGIKIMNRRGEKAGEELISLVEEGVRNKKKRLATGKEIGAVYDWFSGRNRYLAYLLSLSACSFRGYKVGLDCANGSAWVLAKAVFDTLGAQTFVVGNEPDGFNINNECGSTHAEKICRLVKEKGLDIGFTFDGDGDRCLVSDERGELIDGDGILYILAKRLFPKGTLQDGVVGTVLTNGGLKSSLAKEGIPFAASKVGDKYVYEELLKRDWLLGGETSGHIVCRKYSTTGDGILTAIKVMEALVESKRPASSLTTGLEKTPSLLKNVTVANRSVIMSDVRVKSFLFQAEKRLGEGRIVVRPSGTEKVVRIYMEGEEKLLPDIARELTELLTRVDGDISEGKLCAE